MRSVDADMATWYAAVHLSARSCGAVPDWARLVSNQRPLACELSPASGEPLLLAAVCAT